MSILTKILNNTIKKIIEPILTGLHLPPGSNNAIFSNGNNTVFSNGNNKIFKKE